MINKIWENILSVKEQSPLVHNITNYVVMNNTANAIAKRLLPPGKIIGLSVESKEQVIEANNYDVTYIAASPVFSTLTKTNTIIEWSLEGIRWIKSVSRHPLVGIGNMNLETIFSIANYTPYF